MRHTSLKASRIWVLTLCLGLGVVACGDDEPNGPSGGTDTDTTGSGSTTTGGDDDDDTAPVGCGDIGCDCFDVFSCNSPLLCNLTTSKCVACLGDTDCGQNEFCDTDNTCKPKTDVTEGCADGQAPLIQVSRDQVQFGVADLGATLEESVRISNIGQCPLQVFGASVKDATVQGFDCENCTGAAGALKFPLTLAPFTDRVDIKLTFSPATIVPEASAVLQISSNDTTKPIQDVSLRAGTKGFAELDVNPSKLDFGFNKLGSTKPLRISLGNKLKQADGNSPLLINKIEVKGDNGGVNMFKISPTSLSNAGPLPWSIKPEDAIEIEIEYTPLTEADHLSFLTIDSSDDKLDANNYPLTGTARNKPVCAFDPPTGSTIDFGQIPEKTSSTRPFVIANRGGENCVISASFSTISDPEFTLNPSTVPDIGPGGQATNNVVFTPQAQGTYKGEITFLTNDPTAPEVKYIVQGEATEKLATDVIKLQLAAQTPSGNILGNSFQIADLSYEEAITGLVADRRNQSPNWTNIGGKNFGSPKWIAQGSPYPIVISHADASIDDSCYNVAAVYIEDCSFVPSSLLSSIGGIITGAIIGSIGIPGGGGLDISSLCLSRDSFDVEVRVDINGVPKVSKAISLGTKGDRVNAFTIRRRAGLFKVDPYNPGLCNVP
jgi:hypothetical protein